MILDVTTINTLLSFTGGMFSLGIALFVLFKGSRSFPYRMFVVAMILLALEQGLLILIFRTLSPMESIRWNWIRSVLAAFLPGTWLLFSLSFARENYRDFLSGWKWIIVAAFVFPASLSLFSASSFWIGAATPAFTSEWLLHLGWSGYAYHILYLLGIVLILMNFEKTLRSFSGSMQWQIKFMVLGVFALLGTRIYTLSQVLLYASLNTSLESVNAVALIVGNILIIVSLFRSHLDDINIYISQTLLYNSCTMIGVGLYLIAVGVLAQVVRYFGDGLSLPVEAFFIFLAFMGLAVFLLSDAIRQKFKQWINRHLKRPQYDYRKEWTTFTQRTFSLLDPGELCATVTKIVSDTLGSPAVTIWLLDETRQYLTLGGSTFHSMAQERSFKVIDGAFAELIRTMRPDSLPVVLRRSFAGLSGQAGEALPEEYRRAQTWCCAPLIASGECMGFMTVSERVSGVPYSVEALTLLKTIADQTAGSLLNLKFSERLREAKQMEMFQMVSAFFVHDLKNLASSLSLMLQNLPVHFDNPEFRKDTLRMIGQSVDKINTMCSCLSSLNHKMELHRMEADLNELVTGTLAGLNGCVRGALVKELQPVPKVFLDPDQIQKVLLNLVLNASEAVGDEGKIRVETYRQNGGVILSVEDNGCGISKEYLEKSLFQPFKTTKKKGLGIGLFQCKRIIEAHQGRIEVESEQGKGSHFRVVLPLVEKRR